MRGADRWHRKDSDGGRGRGRIGGEMEDSCLETQDPDRLGLRKLAGIPGAEEAFQ